MSVSHGVGSHGARRRPQSLFSTMSMQGSCAKEILKLSLVCSVPLREMLRCLPRKGHKFVVCQFGNGILKRSFVCSVGFVGSALRDIMQG